MSEAEKKDIAKLDFNIDDAKKKLTEIDNLLKQVSNTSESYAKKIGDNLGGTLSTNIINADKIKKDLSNVETIGKTNAKKMATTIMSEEIKVTANKQKEQQKRITNEQKALQKSLLEEQKHNNTVIEMDKDLSNKKDLAAYKSALKQEEYNNRVEKSTKTMYDKISEYAKTYVIYQGFNELKSAAIETVEVMKDVEYRMMEISRIMEDGSINVEKYRDELIQLAYDYGRSFEDVSTVTLNFARAGYNAEDSLAMTEKSLLALNTAELDAQQSTEGLISILAQWDMNTGTTAEKSQNLANVIDKINKTADKFPISSEGLLEALKRTSQGFNLAGATIDETIAMIVAAETASQRGGKVIGTAMANMQNQLKAEGKIDLAKSLGLDLFEDEAETTFKSITEIFSLMSERMQELENAGKGSSTEMQSLLELFTVFRRNIGAGLLSEMSGEDSAYMDALTNSLESAGYSAQENAKYMGTMEAATQQLNATILDLQSTLYDEGGKSIFTGFILGAEGGINVINSLIKTFGVLPTTIATATLAFGLFSKKMNYEGLKKYSSKLKETSTAIKLFNETVNSGEITAKEFEEIMGKDIPKSLGKYTSSLKTGNASMKGYITSTIAATAKQIAFNLAVAAGEALISFGLSAAIQFVVGVINDWINATDKAGESVRDMNSKLEDGSNKLNEYSNRFETLRKEVASDTLTQEEHNSKLQDLIEIQNELIEQFGDEAKGIDLVNGKIEEQKNAIEGLAKADYKKYIQENQKEINKLSKEFTKVRAEFVSGTVGKGGFRDLLQQFAEESGGNLTANEIGRGSLGVSGNIEEITEKYRELYDKIDEYRQTATGKELEYANKWLEKTSNTISKLEEKYSEDLKTYEEYLNNKLQYDEHYSTIYSKIIEARAKLSEALISGDDKQIEEAQNNLNKVYKDAIKTAMDDDDVSEGMVKLLQEQIKNLNESADREQIKLKIGIDAEEMHESIQDIIDDMGDISLEELEEGFDAETLTENIQKLKDKLDESGISVEDFIENFEYLGFSMDNASDSVTSIADNLKYLTEEAEKSLGDIVALEEGFVNVYSAMNEFNEQGYITASTLSNLVDNNLLQYFDVINGKLAINEAAMANAATATKYKYAMDLQEKAAAEIMGIANDDAAGKLKKISEESVDSSVGIQTLTNQLLKVVSAFQQGTVSADEFYKTLQNEGYTGTGLSKNALTQISGVMTRVQKELAALDSINIKATAYERVSAKSSGGSSSSSTNQAQREAEEAAKAAQKAEEEAYKARLEQFEGYVDEKERLEKRWVDKQKELGLLSNKDYMYITQQRIQRYNKYLEELKKATWMNAEDRLKLEKEYTEKIEDLQVDYLGYLQDQLDDEIEALEKANEEKIKLIEEEADAKIKALDKVTESKSRAREEEEYQKERQNILDEIKYWQQRTGREAQEALIEAKKKLQELDEEWDEQLEDWSIEDQIKAIEEQRDTQIKAIEDSQAAEIESMKAMYDAKVKMYAETGAIIYEQSVIQSQALYNAYKNNFIDPISSELQKLNQQAIVAAPTPAPAEQVQQYETYLIKSGDTLSKIAQRYGTTVEKIMAANPYVTNKNKIYAGKTLQIPKFHEGGIFGGNYEEGVALLKRGEVILKPEWSASLDRMMKYFDNLTMNNVPSIAGGPTINVEGDLVKIDAKINDKTDAEFLTRRVEKMLKDKFNIKK